MPPSQPASNLAHTENVDATGFSRDQKISRSVAVMDLTPTKRFYLPSQKSFAPQYSHIYFCRLTELRPILEKSVRKQFGAASESLRYAERIVNISAEKKTETVIIGVVFRQTKAKPSILSLYDQPSHDLIPPPPSRATSPYANSDETVFLEDENARCTLDVSRLTQPLPDAFATGFVIAVKGFEDTESGAFAVSSYAVMGPAPQPSLSALQNDIHLCIVSSLSLSTPSLGPELFLEFLKGNTGDDEEESFAAKVVQVIIAGNLIPSSKSCTPSHKALGLGEKEKAAAAIVDVDRYLSSLSSTVPVSVMPGENDPANSMLPQQPLHRCLLPSSSRNSNMVRVSNPCAFELGGRHVLATSGQNVDDVALYERTGKIEQELHQDLKKADEGSGSSFKPNGQRSLDILETMLNSRHIAPTCPDTLSCYPYCERDPFIVESSPHIMFAGNQKEYATRVMMTSRHPSKDDSDPTGKVDSMMTQPIRLISVPKFHESGQAVFVNLRTLECTVREFSLTV